MVRRVVTGHDEAGRSYFVSDGDTEAVFNLADHGLVFHELWKTTGPLASNTIYEVDRPSLTVLPEPGGTALRVVELAVTESSAPLEMHSTTTTDYNVILSGEVFAITDGGETLLRAGDVLVQRGGRHGWRNDGPDVCVFASVMVNDRE